MGREEQMWKKRKKKTIMGVVRKSAGHWVRPDSTTQYNSTDFTVSSGLVFS